MKRLLALAGFLLLLSFPTKTSANARYISSPEANANDINTWIAFRKDVSLAEKPSQMQLRISCDSRYWLWVNGKLAVFEGQLKRGPAPGESYFDIVDIAPYLKRGTNQVAVLLCYFGKEGFSHQSSGRSGLIIDADNDEFDTNSSWLCRVHPAYGTDLNPAPNFRLPESNITFHAQHDIPYWQQKPASTDAPYKFLVAQELGSWGDAPWGKLTERPIPQWKDYGIKRASFTRKPIGNGQDSIFAQLPYNMQITPIIDITDKVGGRRVDIQTDHSRPSYKGGLGGGEENLRAVYYTRKGKQSYESLGWMNGEQIILVVPSDLKINSIRYRETGYNTEIEGTFRCDDDFINRYWKKAVRTIYVNMRDTYYDCPDRERAQWWFDMTALMEESLYTFTPSCQRLMRKGMLELAHWQKPDGVLFSPIPAGNWDKELPAQMLTSIGHYGFWNYYMNTGDKETIQEVYPAIKRYLALWKCDETGLTAYRIGGWNWGDWGDNRDMRLIFAGWHYIALGAAAQMAELLGLPNDAAAYRKQAEQVKIGFNKCWNGKAYRHPTHVGKTDDRVQALAVISGIADASKYDQIFEVFKNEWHASPGMERFVMDALFRIGHDDYAMQRFKERFKNMVDEYDHTTLFEGWGIGKNGFGGGTINHAWSSGGITVIAQKVCGIFPLEAGYKLFQIEPNPVYLKDVSISFPTIAGTVASSFLVKDNIMSMQFSIPEGTEAIVYFPTDDLTKVILNGKQLTASLVIQQGTYQKQGKTAVRCTAGQYKAQIEN